MGIVKPTILAAVLLTLTSGLLVAGPVVGPKDIARPSLRIIPEPQDLRWPAKPGFAIDNRTTIVIDGKADPRDKFTAKQLKAKIKIATGKDLQIIESGPRAPTSNVIAIGTPSKNAAVKTLLRSWPEAVGRKSRSEGYILAVSDKAIVIRGFDVRGDFYGCQTLIQLVEHYGRKPIDGLFCYDYPDLRWRGAMVRIRDSFDPEFTKEMISEVMARCKLNVIELHMSYGVIWPSHPELSAAPGGVGKAKPATFAEIREVADWAKLHFMEVIPSGVQWTHTWEWQTANGLNSDLLEAEGSTGDEENLCRRNPKAQRLIRDLMNDQIRTFHPKYLQIGWDEIGSIGECPLCKGTDTAKLFSEALWNDRNYLVSRGIKPIMWADMLSRDQNGGGRWNLYRTVATMPKDIIVQDWIYTGHHEDFPSLKTWADNGLEALGAPYGIYKPGVENIYSWCAAAKRHNLLGVVAFNKYRCGGREAVLRDGAQALEAACFVYLGEWTWKVGKPNFSPPPFDGVKVMRRQVSGGVPAGRWGSGENADE